VHLCIFFGATSCSRVCHVEYSSGAYQNVNKPIVLLVSLGLNIIPTKKQ